MENGKKRVLDHICLCESVSAYVHGCVPEKGYKRLTVKPSQIQVSSVGQTDTTGVRHGYWVIS